MVYCFHVLIPLGIFIISYTKRKEREDQLMAKNPQV